MNRNVLVVAALALALLAAGAGQARASDQGTVVVARVGTSPLLLWDATPLVAKIVSGKVETREAMRDLESQALVLLAERLPQNANEGTIRIIYKKTGAVSAAYGEASFAGIERLADISTDRTHLAHVKQLAAAMKSGKTPAGIRVDVQGELPPT